MGRFLRVGAAVQMHTILCQRVHCMDTKCLGNKLRFIIFACSQGLSGAITLKEKKNIFNISKAYIS